jgi:hypothetical protein
MFFTVEGVPDLSEKKVLMSDWTLNSIRGKDTRIRLALVVMTASKR